MHRIATILWLLVAVVASIAASPVGPEVEDPCGDTESYAYDTSVDHPMPEGTDLETVDVVDRDDGGIDIVFDVCGERLPLATNDAVSLSWRVPTSEGCTHTAVSVRLVNDLAQGGIAGTLTVTCNVQKPCEVPWPGACTLGESTTLGRTEVPVTVDGTTLTAVIAPDEVGEAGSGWLVPGTRLSQLRATGATMLGADLGPGASAGAVGVRAALADEASGHDHVLGEDG